MELQAQNTLRMKPGNPILSVRLKEPETIRFWLLMDRAKAKNPYIDKSNVVRELLGLDPLNILTTEDIDYFRTGKKPKVLTPIDLKTAYKPAEIVKATDELPKKKRRA